MAEPETIKAVVASLFEGRVGVGVTDPTREYGAMFHVEHSAIRGAVPLRQREFLAGRAAARMAQAELGLAPRPVGMGNDRAPVWPDGMRGSISHSGKVCVAVVSDDPSISALGLDIEENAALPEDVLETILSTDEQSWINDKADPLHLARLIFSAKECAYKAQYPLSGQLFGFETIGISVNPSLGTFRAHFLRPVAPFDIGHTLQGRFSVVGRYLFTGVCVRA